MISSRGFKRLASNLKGAGLFDFEREEDYNDVYNYVELALLELYKCLEIQDGVTLEGYQYLMECINMLRDFQKNFDQFKIIPLR